MTNRPRARLKRDHVLQAAIELADEGGIDSLSMRKLASRLGLRPMSVYHYVSSKDQLLSGILERVVREFEPAAERGEWKPAVRRAVMSAHQSLMRHPWACTLMMSPARVTDVRLRYMESLLRRLREAGLSAETTDHAYHTLDSHIIGFTLWYHGYTTAMRAAPGDVNAFEELLAGLPYLQEHARQHDRELRADEPTDFEFGLDLILDGLEAFTGPGSR
jgi:AcrR family transcriptional regulator